MIKRQAIDYSALTAVEALSALRNGSISAASYVDALITRAEALHLLNPFITLDVSRARAAAERADSERAARAKVGPLHGLPFVLKDNIDAVGYPTTGGTVALRSNLPAGNAPVTQSLLDAGALLMGKTNLHELSYGVTNNNASFGPARNPYDPERIAGGSSGGVGVAVGARLVPVGIGTDTGGSVRIPAALCGVFGLRPTVGRYSQVGILPVSPTRDTAGPIARTIADLILFDGIITGDTTDIPPANLKGLRVGVPRALFYEEIDAPVAAVIESSLRRLSDYGVILIEADIPDVASLDTAINFPIALYEAKLALSRFLAHCHTPLDIAAIHATVTSPDVKSFVERLLDDEVTAARYKEAIDQLRPQLQQNYSCYFASHNVEAIVFPTTPLAAARIGEDRKTKVNGKEVPTFETYIRNMSPGSNVGIPGLTLPVGLTTDGLPVGLSLDGPAGSDRVLLSIGLAIEAQEPTLPPPNLD